MKYDIVALGEPLYELNQQPDQRFLAGFGGDTSNVAIAASRLGAKCAYVTKIGGDAPGDAFMDLWAAEGVDTSGVSRSEFAPTGLYLVTHSAKGHAFSYYRKGSAASLLAPADMPADLIRNTRYLHVSAISQAISATARESVARAVGLLAGGGAQLCYDTNLRLKLWTLDETRREIEATARHATILKTSQEDGAVLTGLTDVADIARYFRSLGSQTVIVTQGADGVYVASGDDSFHVAGRQVAAVDATGAGDGFTGALLAELCRGQPLRQAVTFANAAAALSTLGYGAVAPLPRREQVAAFLAA